MDCPEPHGFSPHTHNVFNVKVNMMLSFHLRLDLPRRLAFSPSTNFRIHSQFHDECTVMLISCYLIPLAQTLRHIIKPDYGVKTFVCRHALLRSGLLQSRCAENTKILAEISHATFPFSTFISYTHSLSFGTKCPRIHNHNLIFYLPLSFKAQW
jgi:hypothetical protein